MDIDSQLLGILGQGGISAALLFLIWKVGMALVGSVKEIGAKVDKHTADEVEHHTRVREELAGINGALGLAAPRRPTPALGLAVVTSGTKPDGE